MNQKKMKKKRRKLHLMGEILLENLLFVLLKMSEPTTWMAQMKK
jgi:hypothetical protein